MAEYEKEHPVGCLSQVQAEKAAGNFIGPDDAIAVVEEYGRGIIHHTYLVHLDDPEKDFILQRVNTRVFQRPELIMHNLRVLSDHVSSREIPALDRLDPHWKMVRLIPTGAGRDFFIDPAGGFWRALEFIRDASPLEEITSLENVREVGRALGIFHRITVDLDPELLNDTLPDFHNVESYFSRYDRVSSAESKKDLGGPGGYCYSFIAARRGWAPVLENGRRQGSLAVRVIHGDPKINNIMVDNKTGRAVSIIDLDTVKPGLLLYDIGDCLRSCCNVTGEDSENSAAARFDLDRCETALDGYAAMARDCLTDGDFAFLYDAVRLIPFELGLRFFTDYLEGSPYFRIMYPAQNLDRALVQFRLVESIEEQEEGIRALIEKYRLE